MDEQRASISVSAADNKENRRPLHQRAPLNRSTSQPAYTHQRDQRKSVPEMSSNASSDPQDELFDLIASMQCSRMDEQRAALPDSQSTSACASTSGSFSRKSGPAARQPRQMSLTVGGESMISKSMDDDKDDFIDNLMMRLAVTGRIDDQRTCLPDEKLPRKTSATSTTSQGSSKY